jgi:hypothetical protein
LAQSQSRLLFREAPALRVWSATWSLTTPRFIDLFVAGAAENGYACAPPAGLDPRCRPHPIGAFLRAVRLTGAWQSVVRKVYVGAHGWAGAHQGDTKVFQKELARTIPHGFV